MWLLAQRTYHFAFCRRHLLKPSSIDYNKKKDKKAQVKFIKNEAITKDGVYKSHTVSVGSGESPNSLSRPPAKRKPGVVRPITQGKLLRAGGPSEVSCYLVTAKISLYSLIQVQGETEAKADCPTVT